MTKITNTLLFFFLTTSALLAQADLTGIVYDANTKSVIEFVNIGVIDSTIGTVSDEQGTFMLKGIAENASVKFSSIGYESKTVSAATLKLSPSVYLTPVVYQVEIVNINAQKFGSEKKIGKELKRKNTIWGLPFSRYLGAEIGTKIKINRETIIKSVHFGMHARSPDSILFRINLYDYKNGKAGKNLITKNIYAYTHEVADYGAIDLSDLNIVVYDDVLLTVQIIKKEGGFSDKEYVMFRMRTWLYGTNILYREASQAEFRKPKEGIVNDRIGFYLVGKQAGKTKKLNIIPEPIIETPTTLNTWQDSLAYLFEQSTIPGLAVTVVKADSIAFQQTYGQANVAEDIRYTNQTTQPIASISKTFIGLALMQLVEKGHFTLETPINDILPFKVVNPHQPKQQITIQQLVTHTAGLYDTTAYYEQYYIKKGENLMLPTSKALIKENIIERTDTDLGAYLKAALTPKGGLYDPSNFIKKGAGKVYRYSNMGASLAAYLVEVTTGISYAEYVKQHIFKPLSMHQSAFYRHELSVENLATLYTAKIFPLPEWSHPSYPDGNMSTSNADMALYLLEMLKGVNGKGKLLSKEGYATLFSRKSPSFINGKNGQIHTVFWDIAGPRIQHSGGDYGVISFLSFNPTTNAGFYVISNINPDSIGKALGVDNEDIFNQLLAILDIVEDFERQ